MAPDPISSAAPRQASAPPAVYDEDAPEDPRLRLMRRLVTMLLLVLIAGVLTVVIALLLKLKELDFRAEGGGAQTAPVAGPVPGLRPGERLIAASASADRILLTLESADGTRRVVALDGRDFRPLAALDDAGGPR